MERHIIIFKEKGWEVVVDAAPGEFDEGFFLCPEAGEGQLGVGVAMHGFEFGIAEHMAG